MSSLPSAFLILSLMIATAVSAQDRNSDADFSGVDSVLIAGNHHNAEIQLRERSGRTDSLTALTVNQYRALLTRLFSILSLPDSVTEVYASAGESYSDRFPEFHAGLSAATCYDQYRTLRAEGQHSRAYERYVLAEFFRNRHIASEKERLRHNLSIAQQLVSSVEFDRAEEMVQKFESEESTLTFQFVKSELEKPYAIVRDQIEAGRQQHRYESRRVELEKTVLVSFGAGLDPFLKISYSSVEFFDPATSQTFVRTDERSVFSKAVLQWGGEAGVFITTTLMAGARFSSGSGTTENAFLDANRMARKFRPKVEYQSMGIWVRYYLDTKTGFRTFLGVSCATNHRKLSNLSLEGDLGAVFIVEKEQRGILLGGELGGEYVPLSSFPLVLAAQIGGDYTTGAAGVFPVSSLHASLRIGVIL